MGQTMIGLPSAHIDELLEHGSDKELEKYFKLRADFAEAMASIDTTYPSIWEAVAPMVVGAFIGSIGGK
jgi:hypothetical protein